jgi:hypothetical protein
VAAASDGVVSNGALKQAAIAAVQAGPDNENGFDELELNEEDVAMMRANGAAVSRRRDALTHEMMPPMPDDIVDKFLSVIGDAFHHMDHAKVPVWHEAKKAFFVGFRRVWFIMDPVSLAAVVAELKAEAKSEKDIENMMFFNFPYSRERVRRLVPPPSVLNLRVRAVYAPYGGMVDSKTSNPLFTKENWGKANGVLKEILEGLVSDPPGFDFYSQRLDTKGESVFDSNGIALVDCSRGQGMVENVHKHLVTTLGT